jgi:Fic family protein
LLSNLEQYYNSFDESTEIDPLLKLPILHYQLEAIHPFGDGNGRI